MSDKSKPKIGILGFGAMGRETKTLAETKGFEVTEIFDIDYPLAPDDAYEFDVAIDFTLPEAVLGNVEKLAKLGKNAVVGTTGWFDKAPQIEKIAADSGTGIVYGSNFSIGMNMFYRIVREAARLSAKFDDYDAALFEMHHRRKKDSPSGSAGALAKIMIEELPSKDRALVETPHRKIHDNELHSASVRCGEITGTHTAIFDSAADTIELTHRARNRSGFASGALLAAEFVHGKKGLFAFDEVIKMILGDK